MPDRVVLSAVAIARRDAPPTAPPTALMAAPIAPSPGTLPSENPAGSALAMYCFCSASMPVKALGFFPMPFQAVATSSSTTGARTDSRFVGRIAAQPGKPADAVDQAGVGAGAEE